MCGASGAAMNDEIVVVLGAWPLALMWAGGTLLGIAWHRLVR